MNDIENKEKKKSLSTNFIFNLISQILLLLIPLATAPYLARVLGVDVNGQISFSNSIVTYFTLISNFGFTTYGQREIAKYQDDKEKRSYILCELFIIRFLFTIASLTIFVLISCLNVFDEKYKLFLLIQSILIVSCAFDPTFFYQGMENFKGIAIRNIVVKIVCLVLIFLFVKTKEDAWIYVLINSLSSLLAAFAMWPYIFKNARRIEIKNLHIWRHFVPALMIFLPTLAVTIYSVLDKTMIGILSNNPDYENGCYDKAYQLNSMILLLVTVISPVMIPRNAHDYAVGNKGDVRKHLEFSLNYTWLIGTPLIVGVTVLCYSLSSWFLGSGYDEVPLLLQIMSVRFILSGIGVTFGDQLFIVIGKEKYCTIATTAAAVVNFLLNLIFIPRWGATGAAITTALSEFTVTAILTILALRQKQVSISRFFLIPIKKILASLMMFIPLFFLNRIFEYNIWSFLLITAVGIIVYAVMLLILRDSFFLSMFRRGIEHIKNLFTKRRS